MMRSLRWREALLVFSTLFGLGLLGASCAEPESNDTVTCTVTADCAELGFTYVCHQGECKSKSVTRECTEASECTSDEICLNNVCTVGEGDTTDDLVENDVVDDADIQEDEFTEDLGDDEGQEEVEEVEEDVLDITAPTIVSITPGDNAQDVDPNTTIMVTFSEELISQTVTENNYFFLRDSSNRFLPGTITWDEASLTATYTLNEPLWAWSTYSVHLTSGIMDRAQNGLVDKTFTFSTAAPANQGFYDELARAYAPIIHQDVDSPNRDTPMKIDFDGDLLPYNNAGNLSQWAGDAAVYYNVAETESHFFIQYVLYYPIYKGTSGGTEVLHTVNGITVVVKKEGGRLGTLEFYETYTAGSSTGYIHSFYPDCGDASPEPYCPFDFNPVGSAETVHHAIDPALFANTDDYRRVRIYSRWNRHDLCAFAFTSSDFCGHTAEEFAMGQYTTLSLYDQAGAPPAPDYDTTHTGFYQLYPLATPWWTSRVSHGDATSNFYLEDYAYEAPAATQPGASNDIKMPASLGVEDTTGNNGRYSPWAWSTEDGLALGTGIWFIDPAYAIEQRFDTPDDFMFIKLNYCFNLFTGIDRTQTDAPCKPL